MPSLPNTAKKRRQHHVWQHYLKAWSIDGTLHCLMDGRVFPTGTTAIAVEQHFYKIGRLTAADVALVRFLAIELDGVHPLTRKAHESFLKLVTAPNAFEGASEDFDNYIDTFRTNVLEDIHMGIEARFLPLLQRALNKDISFYSDEQSCISLFFFLASQHMRTKGIRVKTIEVLKQKNGLDVSRVWSILSQMYASNIGLSLHIEKEKRKLVLIENTTEITFVTGDQPLINLDGDGLKSPEKLSWYYPISPHLALFLTEVHEEPAFSTASLTSAQVNDLNKRMVVASHRQVFGQSRLSLQTYATGL